MKLTIVSDYGYSTGGIEQFVYEFLNRVPTSIECRLLTWTDAVLAPSTTAVIVVEYGDVRSVWTALDASDVVLIVTSFNVRLLAHAAGEFLRLSPKPAIVVLQTSAHSNPMSSAVPAQREWLDELLEVCSGVVAVSDEVRESLILEHNLDVDSITVIENGARLSRSKQDSASEGSRISFIGRPHPQKGYHLFTRLAAGLRDVNVSFAANTVSIDPDRHEPGIEYSSNLSDAELLDFFSATDLLVAPYLRADGLPLALLEAINCGVPIVGFDSPGVARLLRRHRQHVVAPTYEALEAAVRAWLAGALVVPAPVIGSVPSWDRQCDSYFRLISALGKKIT